MSGGGISGRMRGPARARAGSGPPARYLEIMRRTLTLLVLLPLAALGPALADVPPRPPIAAARPRELTLHGERRVDPYFWLREKSDPRVRAYIEA